MKIRNLGLTAIITVLCASSAAFAQGGLEVTLQVLDDVSDIEGVMMTVERASRGDEESTAVAPPPSPARSETTPAAREPSLGRELDREEESEGELEDFDAAEVDPATL